MNRLFFNTLILIVFFKSPFSFSQEILFDPNLKENWKHYNYKKLDSVYIEAYKKTDTLKMYTVAEILLEKGKLENKPSYCVRAHYIFSTVNYMWADSYEKGLIHIDKAITYLKEAKNYKKKDRIYLIKGVIHQNLGEYELALDSYLKGLELIHDEEDENANIVRISFYDNIATLKSILHDAQGALQGYSKILQLIENEKNESYKEFHKVKSLSGLARAHIDLGNYKKAIQYCQEIISKSENLNDKSILVEAYSGLGEIYSLNGSYEKALYYLEEAQKIENISDSDYFDAVIRLLKARTFFFLQKYPETILELDRVRALVDKHKFNNFHLEEMYVLYAKSYQKLENIEQAYNHLDQALNVKKENDKRKIRLNTNLINKYDLNGLKKDLAVTKSILAKRKRRIKFIQVIFIAALLTCFILFINVRRKNKTKYMALITEINRVEAKENNYQRKEELIPKIEDKKTRELLKQLKFFEDNERYLNKEINQMTLSKEFNTNRTYLSKIINTYKKKSFSTYLIDLRINAAIVKLKKEQKFRAYKVEAIAEEMGFNNVNTFARAFKKKTGIRPSYFIKQLKKSRN